MPANYSRSGEPPGWFDQEGSPFPLGATWLPNRLAYNFALYSKHATSVTLMLFGDNDLSQPKLRVELDYLKNKSGRIWHCRVPLERMSGARFYGYLVDGPPSGTGFERHAFDAEKLLLDPYAAQVFFPDAFDREAARRPGSNLGQAPLSVLVAHDEPFEWGNDRVRFHEHDLVIYELHVRGFTRNPNSAVAELLRGTFLGVIEKIPHLRELGVTAVELMPVHQFDPQEGNYWGYMTLNFFAPHAQYSTVQENAGNEFRYMVRELHAAGIEVILDVVFNHTAEGNHKGPTYSFKGIDNSTYYMISSGTAEPYMNYSGTGNTLHCKNRYVTRMILDSLRSWVEKFHVDGFRFDLASVFNRHADGSISLEDSRIVSAIRQDPVLGKVRLIAEPWDAAGLNQLGTQFPGRRWFQWNGQFRDDIRRFVKGDAGLVPSIMRRIYGSDDLFPDDLAFACHPYQSVNYVNSHDGFTLYDQVSYNERHNQANGEQNRDGHKENYSWNCGWEGDDDLPPDVLTLRKRQAKNFCCLLMLSAGTPMFQAGDEFLNSQGGNNNPFNQDNETAWLDWNRLEDHPDIFRFFRLMIAFRKSHRSIARSRFWRSDVQWYGAEQEIDLSYESRRLAWYLDGTSHDDDDLYVMANADWRQREFEIQRFAGSWRRVVDTAQPTPLDILEPGNETNIESNRYVVQGRSCVVLIRDQHERR